MVQDGAAATAASSATLTPRRARARTALTAFIALAYLVASRLDAASSITSMACGARWRRAAREQSCGIAALSAAEAARQVRAAGSPCSRGWPGCEAGGSASGGRLLGESSSKWSASERQTSAGMPGYFGEHSKAAALASRGAPGPVCALCTNGLGPRDALRVATGDPGHCPVNAPPSCRAPPKTRAIRGRPRARAPCRCARPP